MNANKRIHDTKFATWASLIQKQAESGLPVKQWCDENGVTKNAYYYWKRLIKERANNIRVYDYLELLLTELPKHVDDKDNSFIQDLLPWSDRIREYAHYVFVHPPLVISLRRMNLGSALRPR